jgi:hypothetical protein
MGYMSTYVMTKQISQRVSLVLGIQSVSNLIEIPPNIIQNVRFEVFTAVTMKNAVFWGVT